MWRVFYFGFWKSCEALDFVFFVGDIISGVGLGIFGPGNQALGANAKNQVFDLIFIVN